MAEITQQRLKELLDYDPETGVFRWRKQIGSRAVPGQATGSKDALGYLTIRVDGRSYKAHRLAWLWEHGFLPKVGIDHKNGEPADNRLENLRAANQSENCANARKKKNNTSGYKGVHWHPQTGKWRVRLMKNYQSIQIGMFDDLHLAAAASEEAARELFGEFARKG